MRWYEGGIADAVTLTRQKNAIFVVFIQGTDDKSRQFSELFDNGDVSTKLESDLFVAIRIEANSVPHQQFVQIYKQVIVPSVFFIGKTGASIGLVTEPTNAQEFLQRINGIIGVHTGVTPNESFIKNEQASSSASSNVVCESGVCRLVPSDGGVSESGSSQELSTEEKVEKAKELIEKKREQKEVEEKEKERIRELERRKLGQDVQKMKRWQDDQQLKNIMEEREREKQQERAARERVLAQIAQDKADRAARFSPNQPQSHSNPQPEPPQRTPAANSNTARLQFKLPDGSSHTHEFASSEPLEMVRAYISTNLNLPFRNYMLSTAFPRREFTDNNNVETLADLGLAPNAVVLVLPNSQGTVSTRSGGFVRGLFWTLVAPFFNVFEFLRNFLFGTGTPPAGGTTREAVKRASPDSGEASTSRTPPKRRMGETTVIKRQGNVHRLSDKTDSDDENNTWNGNSTQQM